jgi:DNA-binding transcriptional ArsR family regulator
MNREEFNQVFKSISDFFGLLSNPDRMKILGLLINQELDVHDIQEKLKISQSRVSQHLKLLKLNNIVEERREGKHVYYHVKDANVAIVIESALRFYMLTIRNSDVFKPTNELLSLWHQKEKENE